LRDTLFVCGPGKTILNTYRTLDKDRFSLTLGVPVSGSERNAFIDRARELSIPVLPIPTRGPIDLRAIVRLAKEIKRQHVDIVQSHDFQTRRLAVPAAALAGVTHVTSVHGWIGNTRKERFGRPLDLALIRRADHVVTVSGRLFDQVLEARVPSERVTLLRNAVLLDDYSASETRASARADLALPLDAEIVSIVGRLSPEKGHVRFLEMARRVVADRPAAHFLIVGEGRLRGVLEHQVAEMGLKERVSFLGLRTDMHRIYAATDVVALCSSTEGLPNVILEAFAYAKPVVATRVGGVPEVVTDGHDGFIVTEDANAIADAVLRILRSATLANELGRRGRVTIESRFEFRQRTAALETLYESLTGRVASHTVHTR
jgi:glycosyltransferase involved in cell wall biosynthesis